MLNNDFGIIKMYLFFNDILKWIYFIMSMIYRYKECSKIFVEIGRKFIFGF